MSFLCTRIVKKKSNTVKTPANFLSDIHNGCTVWGVDPGRNSLITAVDSSGSQERQRTVTLEEYYHICGYNDANYLRKKHQIKYEQVFKMITTLPSAKTVDINEYNEACRKRIANYDELFNYYNADNW